MNQARVGVHPRMQAHRMTDLEWVGRFGARKVGPADRHARHRPDEVRRDDDHERRGPLHDPKNLADR